jgi:hypothetical protein
MKIDATQYSNESTNTIETIAMAMARRDIARIAQL